MADHKIKHNVDLVFGHGFTKLALNKCCTTIKLLIENILNGIDSLQSIHISQLPKMYRQYLQIRSRLFNVSSPGQGYVDHMMSAWLKVLPSI